MRVLVLDLQYQPLEVLSWEKAISLVLSNKAEVIEESDAIVRSPSKEFKVPSVIRKTKARYRPRNVLFSRKNIFARDNYECQYCQRKKLYHELTFDHIVPVKHNGATDWENIVACCKPCNIKKADRTPEQAKMTLIRKPIKPEWSIIFKLKLDPSDPEGWLYYLDNKK